MKNFLQKTFLNSRMKSLYWRSASMAIIGSIDSITSHLHLLDLPAWVVMAIGLVMGEITKYLNKHSQNA